MSAIDNGMRIAAAPWWLGRGEEERARRDAPLPERCVQCGASLAGSGPILATWIDTTDGPVCSLECDS